MDSAELRDRALVQLAAARTRHRAIVGGILTALHDLQESEKGVRHWSEAAGEPAGKTDGFIRGQDAALFAAMEDYDMWTPPPAGEPDADGHAISTKTQSPTPNAHE